MSLTRARRSCLATASLVLACAAAPAAAQNHWAIDAPVISGQITGTAAAPFPVQEAPGADEQMPVQLAQQQPTIARSEIDESALRYFAQQGDTRRLEIEIARLRALYPDWTPPADPLAVPVATDEALDALWQLYARGEYAELRRAIAERGSDEEGWEPPADLLERLALSEARVRLINASDIDQHDMVVRIASENPQLLTCSEVDVLWRVAEAFALTEREMRARDAYLYILANCEDPQERLATIQNATRLLPAPLVEELLAREDVASDGQGEFERVRDDLARDAVARADAEDAPPAPADDLQRVEELAREEGLASDLRLLGWYFLRHENPARAEEWFRRARDAEDEAVAAEGLALALVARGAHAEAEAVLHPWRGATDDVRSVYLAAVANLLGQEPRPVVAQDVLSRIVAEVAAARDAVGARQLGWYARAFEQHATAGQWFATALSFDPDDEPAAYGLALTRHLIGDAAGLAEIQRQWAGRSERIAQVGLVTTEPPPAPVQPLPPATPQAAPQQPAAPIAYAPQRQPAASPAESEAQAARPSQRTRTCPAPVDARNLSPQAALTQGWCLMEANRPMEAVRAFEVALSSPSERVRRDAAWGQSLAYLRVELVDEAAVAATRAPQDTDRAGELQTAILAQRAAGAFRNGRYVEALIALDQRARLAPERVDLMVLRGYAYLNLRRLGDAERIFAAAAATGDREAVRGLAETRDAIRAPAMQ